MAVQGEQSWLLDMEGIPLGLPLHYARAGVLGGGVEGGEVKPKGKEIWVLFDLSNGDAMSKRYLWWFDTREEAMAHRKWQKRQRYAAVLSLPTKWVGK